MPLEVSQSLAWAHPVTVEWFLSKFGSPTEPQTYGWPSILAGDATLISAPTGSGKTLAAFLVCIDQLLRQSLSGQLPPCTQVIYVSPLKALSNDIQKNLDAPLAEIQQLAMEPHSRTRSAGFGTSYFVPVHLSMVSPAWQPD